MKEKKLTDRLTLVSTILGIVTAIHGLVDGTDSHYVEKHLTKHSDGCRYEHTLDYNPARIVTCELLRRIW